MWKPTQIYSQVGDEAKHSDILSRTFCQSQQFVCVKKKICLKIQKQNTMTHFAWLRMLTG